MFLTQYSKSRVKHHAPTGDPSRVKRQLVIEPDGNRHLIDVKVIDQYEQIQSYKDSCMIENIVKRAINGDSSVLAATQGISYDTRLLPNNLIEANEAINKAKAVYSALDAKQRAKVGSFNQFINQFATLDSIRKVFGGSAASDASNASDAAAGSTDDGANNA